MYARLFQTARALYLVDQWDGVNRSGLRPINNLVLVRTDDCAPFSAGGWMLTDEERDNMTLASETGILIAVGSQAYKITLDGRPWPDSDQEKPKVGDRIWFRRYAGSENMGFDKRVYRMMNDSNVGGIFDMTGAPEIPLPPNVEVDENGRYVVKSMSDALLALHGEDESEIIITGAE